MYLGGQLPRERPEPSGAVSGSARRPPLRDLADRRLHLGDIHLRPELVCRGGPERPADGPHGDQGLPRLSSAACAVRAAETPALLSGGQQQAPREREAHSAAGSAAPPRGGPLFAGGGGGGGGRISLAAGRAVRAVLRAAAKGGALLLGQHCLSAQTASCGQ